MVNSRIPILLVLAFLPSLFICFQNGIRYLQQDELTNLEVPGEPPAEETEGALTTTESIEQTTPTETSVVAQGSTTTTIEPSENNEVTEMIIIPVVLIPQESSEENFEQPESSEQPETEIIGTATVTEVGTPLPTETIVVPIGEEENIIIQIENNQELMISPAEENEFISEETGIIATWWSFENEETAFENWGDLESFIEAEFGVIIETAINTNAEELPVNLETIIEAAAEAPPILETITETQVEIIEFETVAGTEVVQEAEVTVETIVEATVQPVVVDSTPETETTVAALGTIGHTVSLGGMHANAISVPNPDCKQVQTCQIVRVRGIPQKVCKNQLVCT